MSKSHLNYVCTCGKIGTTGCFAHSWSSRGFHVSIPSIPRLARSGRRTGLRRSERAISHYVMSPFLDRMFLCGAAVGIVFSWIYLGWRVIEAVTR